MATTPRRGSELHLYAELLPNIRQITFYASQSSGPDSDKDELTANSEAWSYSTPQLSLSESRSSISVSCGNQTQTLLLPARVSENARRVLSNSQSSPDQKIRDFSVRLQVDDSDPAAARVADQHDVPIPWSAKDLGADTRVRCRDCDNNIFIPRDDGGTVWKDLPSADWAEMMDLWHCHKPDPQEDGHPPSDPAAWVSNGDGDKNENVKGYGAANRVACTPGVVFVDVASFVFAESDCQGLRNEVARSRTSSFRDAAESQSRSQPSVVLCHECGAHIGEEHSSLNGLKLNKSNVSVSMKEGPDANRSEHVLREKFPTDMILAAQLLVLIDRTGARRFVIHSGDDPNHDGILIWVFNPTLRYSSLNSAEAAPTTAVEAQRAMKVFYQLLPTAELRSLLNPESGKAASTTLEELSLSKEIYETAKGYLETSNMKLPHSARMFREWKAGLLNVYEGVRDP